jgi:hypothetical protein
LSKSDTVLYPAKNVTVPRNKKAHKGVPYRVFCQQYCHLTIKKGVYLLMGLTFLHALPLTGASYLVTTFETAAAQV